MADTALTYKGMTYSYIWIFKNNFQNLNFTDKFGLQGNQINIIYMINDIKMNNSRIVVFLSIDFW